MLMKHNWDNYRSAFEVAKAGSLSQAAKHLGMSHSTLLRHIDKLEQYLRTKLFIRHQRGYQLTEAGRILLEEVPKIQHAFSNLESRIQDSSDELQGEIIVTTVPSYAMRMHKAFRALMTAHPKLKITMLATDEVIPLDSGKVHVAVRPGKPVNSSDVIVKPLSEVKMKLYASTEYAAQYGMPEHVEQFNLFHWVIPTGFKRNIPMFKSLLDHVDADNVVYQSNHFSDMAGAIAEGMGIGMAAENLAKEKGLIETPYQINGQSEPLWFIYHRDLRNQKKVFILYDYLKASFESSSL